LASVVVVLIYCSCVRHQSKEDWDSQWSRFEPRSW
jgi:hypothetical protein